MIRKFVIIVICICFLMPFTVYGEHAELEVIKSLLYDGKVEDARNRLKTFRRAYPDNPLAIFLLALLEEDFNRAVALLKEVEILTVQSETAKPDSALAAEAVFTHAEMLFPVGNLLATTKLYERLIKEYPSSSFCPDAYYRLGIIKLVSGSHEEAISYFNTYLEHCPEGEKRTLAITGIMECNVKLKRWSEVHDIARQALEENDEGSAVTPRILEVIAQALHELGDEDNAALYTNLLLKNYPDSYQSHLIREQGNRAVSGTKYIFDPLITNSDTFSTVQSLPYPEEGKNGKETLTTERHHESNQVFSVQASAFLKRQYAYAMYKNLKDSGFDVRIVLKTSEEKHFYTVLIGHFNIHQEAEKMAGRVSKATGIKANVVIME